MNIHMKIFRSQRFDPLRVVMLDDEPWYIVADICRTLGYGNATKAVRLVRQEDKTIIRSEHLCRQQPGKRCQFKRSGDADPALPQTGRCRRVQPLACRYGFPHRLRR